MTSREKGEFIMASRIWDLTGKDITGGVTTPEERQANIRAAIATENLRDAICMSRNERDFTFEECYRRVYGEPLSQEAL